MLRLRRAAISRIVQVPVRGVEAILPIHFLVSLPRPEAWARVVPRASGEAGKPLTRPACLGESERILGFIQFSRFGSARGSLARASLDS